MEKLQLYEKVLNKMKYKKLLEERNRPHYEVFRLEAEIAYEGGQTLKLGIKELESNLAKENERLKRLKHSLRELYCQGRKDCPRIIIKPYFIALETVKPEVKEFFRKAANNFMALELFSVDNYKASMEVEKYIVKSLYEIHAEELRIAECLRVKTNNVNQLRIQILKYELKIREIETSDHYIRKKLENYKYNNRSLLETEAVVKSRIYNSTKRLYYLSHSIKTLQTTITYAYSPAAYRYFRMKVFMIRAKKDQVKENLGKILKQLEGLYKETKYSEVKLKRSLSVGDHGRVRESKERKYKQNKLHFTRQNTPNARQQSYKRLFQTYIKRSPSVVDYTHRKNKNQLISTAATSKRYKKHNNLIKGHELFNS